MDTLITDPLTRILIALDCDPAILLKYERENFALHRALVALHKNTPIGALDRLVCDPDEMVAGAAAGNPNLSLPGIIRASFHASEVVRAGAAYNTKLPDIHLERLLKDDSDIVSSSARRNMERRQKK